MKTEQSPTTHQKTDPDPEPKPWRTEGLEEPPAKQRPPSPPWINILAWSLIFYLASFAFFSFQDLRSAPKTISYSEFCAQVEAHNVKEVYSRGDTIQGELKEARPIPKSTKNEQYVQFSTERPTFADDNLLAQLAEGGAIVSATPVVEHRGPLMNLLLSFAPWLLLIGFYVWMYRRMSKSGGIGGIGLGGSKKAKPVDPEKVRVTFDDVAGIDEVEAQVAEIVDFLKNPNKYSRLGARPPKGVLLSGRPGTGKTLLARATAGEAGVPFFSASASEFVEMLVGMGARRVRELFEEARKVAPSIIFIDEIDTIGRSRGGPRAMGGHDEREQTLNQILTEMDGFDGSEGVVVMAATNRAEVLDAALTRAGRFDRQITVCAPDREGRVQILKVHTRKVPLAKGVDLEAISRATPGMTGAELANLVNEGAILAAKREADAVTQADLLEALDLVRLGVARQVVIPEEERRRTAYHEAGHALLGMLQAGADPVRSISIIPRGQALGVTVSTPDEDRYGYDETYLRGKIMGALGGWAAEETVLGFTTSGVDNDLEKATAVARMMVGRWGMSEKVGAMSVLSNDGDPRMLGIAEQTLANVDAEARRILVECQNEAKRLLVEHRDKLDSIVDALMEHETLDEDAAYRAAGIERPSPSGR